MSKMYVLVSNPAFDSRILGVYSSAEKADKAVSLVGDEFCSVFEVELDAAPDRP